MQYVVYSSISGYSFDCSKLLNTVEPITQTRPGQTRRKEEKRKRIKMRKRRKKEKKRRKGRKRGKKGEKGEKGEK